MVFVAAALCVHVVFHVCFTMASNFGFWFNSCSRGANAA
jgi:hypothetical protein